MMIQKYLAEQGICSRREAEKLLKAGLIQVNGRPATPGVPLTPADKVTIDPAAQKILGAKTTIAIYKPRGVMCTKSQAEGMNVFDMFQEWQHLNLVGRLDKESEGLLLLSDDGLITKQITGSQHRIEKEYEIITLEEVDAETLQPLETGMVLSDGPTLPANIHFINRHMFRIILKEGRNRQIRRMCGQLGLTVTGLKRIRIGSLKLNNLWPGDWRRLTLSEIQTMKKHSTGQPN
ncbi:MAG: rRNA pseudouridine synthase [Candidatus Andersenbacteria bacterium]|nr:rRNA pseudouridine synthase [Candidatus Andersenbacteria bacterium]